jgi:hypothetical protein
MVRQLLTTVAVCLAFAAVARAQDAPPPAYLAVVEGNATLERDAELLTATQNMPFVPGDRLRTTNGRVQIVFPDGTGIEVAENSEVECLTPTRVRLIAGTMDHLQREIPQTPTASYLPQDLTMYASTLDQSGSWQYDSPYGYVWYPTVAPDWRPYYYGYWSPVRSYGWTWIGLDTWAWPTHHYGRWGYARNRWFWIPGRTWGPAWVSWAAAPDYVSWCPLGFDSRPVFAWSIGARSTYVGWTVLPRSNFGVNGYYAHRYAIDARRLPATTPFIAHSTPPLPARGFHSVITGRQAPADSRRAAALPRVVTSPAAQAPAAAVAVPRQPDGARQAPVDPRQDPARWSRNPQSGVQTHYGMAVPRTPPTTTANGSPQAAPTASAQPPDYRPQVPNYRPRTQDYSLQVPPEYRPPTPNYRAPNEYRIQRMDPRVVAPPAATPPPAQAAPPRLRKRHRWRQAHQRPSPFRAPAHRPRDRRHRHILVRPRRLLRAATDNRATPEAAAARDGGHDRMADG